MPRNRPRRQRALSKKRGWSEQKISVGLRYPGQIPAAVALFNVVYSSGGGPSMVSCNSAASTFVMPWRTASPTRWKHAAVRSAPVARSRQTERSGTDGQISRSDPAQIIVLYGIEP